MSITPDSSEQQMSARRVAPFIAITVICFALAIQHGWFVLLWSGIGLTALVALFIPFLPRWARDAQFERDQAERPQGVAG